MATVKLNLSVWEKNYSASANTSDISWSLSVTSENAYNGYADQCPYVVRYNNSSGSVVSSGNKAFDNNTTTSLASGTISNYKHNDDGSGSITLYAHYTTGVTPSSASTTNTITLTKINRYATISKFEIVDITSKSFGVDWDTNVTCDSVQYSLNNGEWKNPSYSAGTYFRVDNLKGNTKYDVKIRIKKTDTQLWTVSETKSVTTLKSNIIRLKKDSNWKVATPYINVNGSWKEATPYINVNGVWKEGV